MIKIKADYRKPGVIDGTKLIDGRSAPFEIGHHLCRDALRIGIYALRTDAVIPGENERLNHVQARHSSSLPSRQKLDKLFQPAQRSHLCGARRHTASDPAIPDDATTATT